MSQQCAVYILVEPDQFKIGHSVSVAGRAKLVTPNVIWEKSSALYFDTVREAINCEKAIHFLFRSSRLAPQPRDGGTEFFSLDCLQEVEAFIEGNRERFGFQIKRGHSLLPTAPAKEIVSKVIPLTKKPKISSEERAASAKIINEGNAQRVFEILKDLKDRDILKGRFIMNPSSNFDIYTTQLVLASRNEEPEGQVDLFQLGIFHDVSGWPKRLFGSQHWIRDKAGNYLSIISQRPYDVSSGVCVSGQDEVRKCFSATFELIDSLPVLSDVQFDIIYSAFQKGSITKAISLLESKNPEEQTMQSLLEKSARPALDGLAFNWSI